MMRFQVHRPTMALVALLARPVAGQTVAGPGSYRVVQAREPIALDARLREASWRTADSITDLRQRDPVEGAPATERTVVKTIRSGDALYVAIIAYDRDMAGVRATQLRRDADLSSDDNVEIVIDSYRDRRGAFLFATNPNGAMWDAQLVGLDNLNASWNGIWDVATRRDSASWTAEFAIPLRTLRFRPGNDAIGLNVRRFIRRKNEEDLWQSWRRQEGLDNLLNTGDLIGFADVIRGDPLELYPYVLGHAIAPSFDSAGNRLAPGSGGGKAGLDAKFAVTPTLTSDLTLNTDFAQTEVDSQVINLTRFPTFFPEKRQFFLESSGLFELGTPGRVQLFYSRRIGLDSNGAPVPILGGARLYGKSGPWGIGLLDVRTGGSDNANDVAVRLSHDLFERSSIGVIATDRSAPGLGAGERGAGTDWDFPLVVHGYNVEPHAWLFATRTPQNPGTPLAWRLSTDFPNDLFDNFVSLYSIDSGFAPTLGFVRRTGVWETTGHVDFQPRPGMLDLRRLDLTPIPSWDIIADRAQGDLSRPSTWQTADFAWHVLAGNFESGDHFELNVNRDLDAPTSAFDVFRSISIPAGRYWWTSGNAVFSSSPGRPLSFAAALGAGQFYDGHSSSAQLGATYAPGGHVILSASDAITAARVSGGAFTATEAAGRAAYAFTPRLDFQGFVQVENADRRADFNLRLHWIPRIGDDLFVVWNSGFTDDPEARWRFPERPALAHPLNGALAIKAVHRMAP